MKRVRNHLNNVTPAEEKIVTDDPNFANAYKSLGYKKDNAFNHLNNLTTVEEEIVSDAYKSVSKIYNFVNIYKSGESKMTKLQMDKSLMDILQMDDNLTQPIEKLISKVYQCLTDVYKSVGYNVLEMWIDFYTRLPGNPEDAIKFIKYIKSNKSYYPIDMTREEEVMFYMLADG